MELFECIKPNPYPLKGRRFIGYGCIPKHKNKYDRVNKRKYGRYIRKYGFDLTETWSLDYTIAAWLSDNVGGFFRRCGLRDDWSDYDLEGNERENADTSDIKKLFKEPKNYRPFYQAEEAREEEFLKQLDNFLKTADKDIIKKFINFVVPRLMYLAQNAFGYPGDFKTFDEWQNCLKKMCEDLFNTGYSETFIKHFYSLWT